ncbi:MAG TPA: hypothetical protein VMZ92_04800 [Planctomycetota bacterium]|nr:hypothetical protein [Planctomycetota bacterium]
MLRKNVIWICLVAFVLATAGIAFAKAVKLELKPYPEAAPNEPGASGHAILNYSADDDVTQVQVNCWGLTPGTEYTVYVWQGGGPVSIGTFTAKKRGQGHLHVEMEGNTTGLLPIYVSNPLLPAPKAVLKGE